MGAAVAKRQNKVTSKKKNDMRPPSQEFDARYRPRLTTPVVQVGTGRDYSRLPENEEN